MLKPCWIFVALLAGMASAATWAEVRSPWGPRASLQAGFNSSRVLLIGGKTADGDSSEVWEYASDAWKLVQNDGPFGARHAGIVIVSEERIFLMTGVASPFGFPELMDDVWYAPANNATAWTRVANSAPLTARAAACGVIFNKMLWVMGGMTFAASANVFQSTDLSGESWGQAPDAPWKPRGYAACAVFKDRVFLAGGTDLERAFSDVWTTTDAITWNEVTPRLQSWPPRASASLLEAHGWLWYAGGVPAGTGMFATVDATNWKVIQSVSPWDDISDAPVVPEGEMFAVLGGIRDAKQQIAQQHHGAELSDVVGRTLGEAYAPLWLTPAMREMRTWQRQGSAQWQGPAQRELAAKAPEYSDSNFLATTQLYCDRSDIICSGHGACAKSLPQALPGLQYPDGFGCVCDEGWAQPDCAHETCVHPFNCVHGQCQTVSPDPPSDAAPPAPRTLNSTSHYPAGVSDATVCVCETGWTTPKCDVAICLSGCDADHGSCSRPNQCICTGGWRGIFCNRPDTPIEALGELVQRNAPAAFGVVTSISLTLATAVGCFTNYWTRRPKRVDAVSRLIRRRRASSRYGKQSEMQSLGVRGGYGTMAGTPSRSEERSSILDRDSMARESSASGGESLAMGGNGWVSEEAVAGGRFRLSMDHFNGSRPDTRDPIASPAVPPAGDGTGFTPMKDIRTGVGAPSRRPTLPSTMQTEAASQRRSSRASATGLDGGPGRVKRRGSQRAWLRADDRDRFASAGGVPLQPSDSGAASARHLSSLGSDNSSVLEQPTGTGNAIGGLRPGRSGGGGRTQNPFGL